MNPTDISGCPYRGLVPFSARDAATFFGRDAEIRIVSANLLAARLTLLYGDSGVGKSSILHAGVVPHLQQVAAASLRRLGRPRFRVVVVDQWQGDPLAAISDRLAETLGSALAGRECPSWRSGEFVAHLAEWTKLTGGPLLLIFDQFEDYLRYHEGEAGEATFAEEFPRAILQPDLEVNVLLAIREDEYARLDRFKAKLPGLYRNYLRLRSLGRDAARRAILGPLEVARAAPHSTGPTAIEPALVEVILDEARSGRVVFGDAGIGAVRTAADTAPIQTPYLQLVLTRVWHAEAAANSDVMRLATYRRLGGADQIVRLHLDGVLAGFPSTDQALAAAIFRHLVTPSGAKVAHSLTDLAEYAHCKPTDLRPLLDRLCGSNRVLRPVAPGREQPGLPRFEIFTDSLAKPVLDWGNRFRRAQEKAEAEARLAEERRRKLVFLRLSIGLAAAFVVAAVLGTLAWLNWRAATVRELVTQAEAARATDPESSVELMLQAADLLLFQSAATRQQTERSLRAALLASHRRPATGAPPAGLVQRTTGEWTSPDGAVTLRTLANRKGVLELESPAPAPATGTTNQLIDTGFNEEGINVIFSGDGARVAFCGPHGARVQRTASLASNSPPILLPHPGVIVRSAAFHPTLPVLATVGDGGTNRFWDLVTGRLLHEFSERAERVNDVVFSPDGRFIATARSEGAAVWKADDGAKVANLRAALPAIHRVRFADDGQALWTADATNGVERWASRIGRLVAEVPRGSRIVAAAPGAGGFQLITTDDNATRVWRQTEGSALTPLASFTNRVEFAAFSSDGRFVATARDREVQVRDTASSGGPLAQIAVSNQLLALSFSPQADRLATLDRNGTTLVWRWRDGTHGPAFQASKAADGQVVFDPTGGRLIVASGNQPRVFSLTAPASTADVVTNAAVEGPLHESSVTGVALAHDGLTVLSLDDSGGVVVWNLATGRPRWRVTVTAADPRLMAGALTPDSRFAVVGGAEGVADIWDLSRTNRITRLPGHRSGDVCDVIAVWFADRGGSAFTVGSDGTVRQHDTRELLGLEETLHIARERRARNMER